MIKLLRKLIYGGKNYLRPYEALVIRDIYESLSKGEEEKFAKQLDRIDIVQRSPENELILFYDLDDLENRHWPDEILFVDKSESAILHKGKINLMLRNNNEVSISYKVNIQDGSFFGVRFGRNIEQVSRSYKPGKVMIKDILSGQGFRS